MTHFAFPIIRQHFDWTCGPTALLMARAALGDLEPDIELTYNQEKIWREVGIRVGDLMYSIHPTLAIPLLRDGYKVEIWHEFDSAFQYKDHPWISQADFDERMSIYMARLAEARKAGLILKVGPIDTSRLATNVARSDTVSIGLTRISMTRSSALFHHRLLYDFQKNKFEVACPVEGRMLMTTDDADSYLQTAFGRGLMLIKAPA